MSKLPLEILEETWAHLKKHNKREALFLISGVPLMDVAQAVALDQKERIVELLQNGQMRRPNSQEVLKWESNPEWKKHLFSFVIVQPFVFVELPVEDC